MDIRHYIGELKYLKEQLLKNQISEYNYYRRIEIIKAHFNKYISNLSKEAQVGETRQWKDGKYQKQADGTWKRINEENNTQETDKKDNAEISRYEKLMIQKYTDSEYLIMNKFLAGREVDANTTLLKHNIQVLSRTLSKLPPHKGKVYRVISLDDSFDDWKGLEGDIVQFKTFLSSSRDLNTAKEFGDYQGYVLFEIESETGRDISEYSVYKGEEEVLFKPGCVFKIEKVKKQKLPGGFISVHIKMKEL